MTTSPKKGFSAFLRPAPSEAPAERVRPEAESAVIPLPREPDATSERTRHVTSTGRVRTHTANRSLPGVTLRLTEDRWEKLKMLSIQERRPIQDILGEALDGYMKGRGLPW